MRRMLLLLAITVFSTFSAMAQDGPMVTAELDATETVIGQPLVLRIKVLVPTWLPQPPEFPPLDLPGLLVRLPERASGPISERVGSDTWSGVQRAYRLYPLQPGRFEIPGQSVRITYANPGGSDPVTEDIALEPIAFNAVVPEPAHNLDPLIVATGFILEAKVEGRDGLAVGGAVVRTLEATIIGTTPILIPQLAPEAVGDGLRSYPDEPRVTDKEDRGTLSGTRTERTTYLATAEGPAELPEVRFDWYNLETGKVETVEIPRLSLSIAPGEEAEGRSQPVTWWKALVGVAAAAVVALVLRAVWPLLSGWASALKDGWRASEIFATRQVLKAIRSRDLGGSYAALEDWARFHPDGATDDLRSALFQVGRGRYARDNSSSDPQGWKTTRKSFLAARRAALRAERLRGSQQDLKPLNPDWRAGD
ncbi:hypothetical protein [Ruegeria hyattellae]|uniref:hypothetical protein n=1 Tax=Ruegeria hyattellae TaxID=3233337 RepID=UPI00355BDAF3